MDLTDKRIVVTGGAGLIGSQLTADLVADNDVVVVDDLSNGRLETVPEAATFVDGDLQDERDVASAITHDVDVVFHLAAADKYVDTDSPRRQFEANTRMTHNVLERMEEVGVDAFAFTSSCTVYGEAGEPTPEDYGPLEPISSYGATKLAEESVCSVYAHSHEFSVWTFRFANIVGPRFGAGVVPDFVEKLDATPETLEILGNGEQRKSYMHVTDCTAAMRHVVEHTDAPLNVFNLGTRDTTDVTAIADIVADEMGLDPEYAYTGGDRGWTGDIPVVYLPIDRLLATGFEPQYGSDQAVRRVTSQLLDRLD
ncbi:NAD-dependent epimerase/dehydratase family protein [Halomarina oriensis]|uniref:NAD-dependent epimerase/dehydratase family protein n=1 Tax=Halomarina oriensis TaxID=671145 RepID=A0A6B0GLX4_9EURY|nr:NAD-dependent epimerase/dehydratase family protein [Halomarina oriensis]MWG35852.1 NAD-dependent epimerase/dehydratase family protein [Halomarina oriensis]